MCLENNAPCVQELLEPTESDLEHVQTRMYGPLTFCVIGRHFPTLPVGVRLCGGWSNPPGPASSSPPRPSPLLCSHWLPSSAVAPSP